MEMWKNKKDKFNHIMDDLGHLFDLVQFTTPIIIQMLTICLLMRFYVGMYKKKISVLRLFKYHFLE